MLARFELHPNDADHGHLRRAWQRLLFEQLQERRAVTMAEFVREWQERRGTEPMTYRRTSQPEPPAGTLQETQGRPRFS